MTKNFLLILFVILISVGVTSAYAVNITLGGTVDITETLNMMGNKITNLGAPTADTDAATKAYVDSAPGTDTLALLGCATDQIAMFDETIWICVDQVPTLDTSFTTYQITSSNEIPAAAAGFTNEASILCDAGDKALNLSYFFNERLNPSSTKLMQHTPMFKQQITSTAAVVGVLGPYPDMKIELRMNCLDLGIPHIP